MSRLITTLGPLRRQDAGFILPHEHVFVDFRLPDDPEQGRADLSEVIAVMAPEIDAARALGVTAQVDCTPVGLARRADVLEALSARTGMPFLVPTGVYREPHVPSWVREATEDRLAGWMLSELEEGIEGTGVRAAWIKLSVGDDGPTPCESKVLRAAARAAAAVDAVIGSHTARGEVALHQIDVIEAAGYRADRFIWIHTQAEPDVALHHRVARRGAWLEYDAIGDMDDEYFIEQILAALAAGFGSRVLLSQDRGWYDPAVPGGGVPRPYTYLQEEFLPKLKAAGVDDTAIRRLTRANPFDAFAR